MVNYSFTETEIRKLWKHSKNKQYIIKYVLNRGFYVKYIIFDDKKNKTKCTGKVVTKFSEGEVYHWPCLHHSSLAPLLDILYIDERLGIYMTSLLTRTLRDIIHDYGFVGDPLSFNRKKAYIEDVLRGLDYIHSKHLTLMNISDANVFVCTETDKAVITNFTCLAMIQNASKHRKCMPYMFRAPELTSHSPFTKTDKLDPILTDLWSFGVLAMEVFLSHTTPWGLVDYEPSRAPEVASKIDYDWLKVANKESFLTNQEVDGLKKFLRLFLDVKPKNRCSARIAASNKFIQNNKYRVRINKELQKISTQSGRKLKSSESVKCDKFEYSSDNSERCQPNNFQKRRSISDYEVVDPNILSTNDLSINHGYLEETPTANTNISDVTAHKNFKHLNLNKDFDKSSTMYQMGISSRPSSTIGIYEQRDKSNKIYNATKTDQNQTRSNSAGFNEIQEAATNLNVKLGNFYSNLEVNSNSGEKSFPEKKPGLKRVETINYLNHDLWDELMIKARSRRAQTTQTMNNNKQENKDSLRCVSDNVTQSYGHTEETQFQESLSDSKVRSTAKNSTLFYPKLIQASAPVMRNLTPKLKVAVEDQQPINRKPRKNIRLSHDHHRSQTNSKKEQIGVGTESKATVSSKCDIDSCSTQTDNTQTFNERIQVGKEVSDPYCGTKPKLNHYSVLSHKEPTPKDKSSISVSQDAWCEEVNDRKLTNFLEQDSIVNRKDQKSSSSRFQYRGNEPYIEFSDRDSLVKNQVLDDTGSKPDLVKALSSESDINSFSHLHQPPLKAPQLKVTRHRRGCPHQRQNKSKRNQFKNRDKGDKKDHLNAKQKCEVSKFLLKTEDKSVTGDLGNSKFYLQSPVLREDLDVAKNEDAKKGIKNKKGKKKTFFCFARK